MPCVAIFWLGTLGTAALMLLGGHANAAEFSASFSGFQERSGLGAGEAGAIFSPGKATLDLDLNSYSGLPSTAAVTQAHIHFAKVHVAGGIIAFFCSNLGNGPMGTPACPTPNGTVMGTITSASVVGPTAQNVNPGDFDALVAALDSNAAYGTRESSRPVRFAARFSGATNTTRSKRLKMAWGHAGYGCPSFLVRKQPLAQGDVYHLQLLCMQQAIGSFFESRLDDVSPRARLFLPVKGSYRSFIP